MKLRLRTKVVMTCCLVWRLVHLRGGNWWLWNNGGNIIDRRDPVLCCTSPHPLEGEGDSNLSMWAHNPPSAVLSLKNGALCWILKTGISARVRKRGIDCWICDDGVRVNRVAWNLDLVLNSIILPSLHLISFCPLFISNMNRMCWRKCVDLNMMWGSAVALLFGFESDEMSDLGYYTGWAI
jgi:hypothetical protein